MSTSFNPQEYCEAIWDKQGKAPWKNESAIEMKWIAIMEN